MPGSASLTHLSENRAFVGVRRILVGIQQHWEGQGGRCLTPQPNFDVDNCRDEVRQVNYSTQLGMQEAYVFSISVMLVRF